MAAAITIPFSAKTVLMPTKASVTVPSAPAPIDKSMYDTGIPQSYHNDSKTAASWYWSGNPVNAMAARAILTPNDDRAAATAAGASVVTLKGSRSIWEEYSGGAAVVQSKLFMKPLYTYCQQRIDALLRHRATAEASPDGGWAWARKMATLCDAALRATNVSSTLLNAMLSRRPGLLSRFRPCFSSTPLGQGNIQETLRYAFQPTTVRSRDTAALPEDVYGWPGTWSDFRQTTTQVGSSSSAGGGYYQQFTEDQVRVMFQTQRGVSWVGGAGAMGLPGPATRLAQIQATAQLITSSPFEAWAAEAMQRYLGQAFGTELPPNERLGSAFVSMQDLNDAVNASQAAARAMVLGAAIKGVTTLAAGVSGQLKKMGENAIQLFTMAFAAPPPDFVSLLNFYDTPFRRVLSEEAYSTAPYPGDTATVTNRIFNGLASAATALVPPAPPGTPAKVAQQSAISKFLSTSPVEKKPFLSPLGVVGLAVLSVVGIAYWKSRK